jgi:hypothetical protein
VLADESAAARDEYLHLRLHSIYVKSFDIKLYGH